MSSIPIFESIAAASAQSTASQSSKLSTYTTNSWSWVCSANRSRAFCTSPVRSPSTPAVSVISSWSVWGGSAGSATAGAARPTTRPVATRVRSARVSRGGRGTPRSSTLDDHAHNASGARSPRWTPGSDQVFCVDDPVGVALLGQEPLPVRREVLVDRVPRDHRVEGRGPAVGLRPHDPAQPLCLLLAGAERPADLDRHRGLRQVDREVGHFAHHEAGHLAGPERAEQPLPLPHRRRPRDQRRVQVLGQFGELVQVLADHQHLVVSVPGHQAFGHPVLARRRRSQPVLVLALGCRVGQALGVGQGEPDLDALGRGDPPLGLDVLPWRVEPLGPDQGEHVVLAPVLAHQGRGQAQPPAGLQVGGHPEHGCRQQVHLVVDHQAPVARVEQLQVGVDALPAGGQHLVGRDGDRPDLLAGAGVLPDLGGSEGGPAQQLVPPLARGHRVGHPDQGGAPRPGHRVGADQGLARPAGQHHDAGAAVPEAVNRLHLVGPQRPRGQVEVDRVRLAVDVAGQVLDLSTWSLRPYQVQAVDSFWHGGSGVVVLPCGAGKTLVGTAAMARARSTTLILVTNTVAARQWRDELLRRTTLTPAEIGEYSGARKEIRPVTIATYQVLTTRRKGVYTHLELFDARDWGLVIYDEVHLLPAPVFRMTADLQARRRLGLTATLVREDGREDDVFTLIGPKRFDAPWKDIEAQGWIAPAECVEVRLTLPDAERLAYATAEREDKYRLAATASGKNRVTERLVARHADDQVLVIGQYLDQLAELAEHLDAPLITGATTVRERQRLFGAFRTGEVSRLVVSKVANFSIDLPEAAVAIQVSGSFGSRQEEAQRLGRIMRPKADGRTATFYTVVSRDTVDQDFAAHRQRFLAEQGYTYRIIDAEDLV